MFLNLFLRHISGNDEFLYGGNSEFRPFQTWCTAANTHDWLVVSNMNFIFHKKINLPIDELIFFTGVAKNHQPDDVLCFLCIFMGQLSRCLRRFPFLNGQIKSQLSHILIPTPRQETGQVTVRLASEAQRTSRGEYIEYIYIFIYTPYKYIPIHIYTDLDI